VNKFIKYIFFFLLLINCSLGEKEEVINQTVIKDIFEVEEPITDELNPELKIELTKITNNNVFLENNSNNSGNVDFETDFKIKKKYKFSIIEEFDSNQPELSFTYDDSYIFFDGKGSIFKINENQEKLWKVNYYNKKEKKLNPILYFANNGKNLVVTDTLSKLYSLNLNNGKLIWSRNSSSPFNSNLKIFKNKFMTVDFDNVIRCFSLNDGKELWNFQTENSFIKSQKKLSLALKGEVIYFINNLGDVTALNANDGSLVWQTPTQSNVIYQNAFSLENSDLVFANDSIYFSNNKNEIFSIDARTGIINWKQKLNSSLRPTIAENFIFSISNEGYLFVIDDNTGNIIRITNALKNIKNKKNKIKPTGFIIAKNKVFLSLNNGRLIKIDITSGAQENLYKLGGSKISRPYVYKDKMYLIKNNSIIIYN
tara:strand:+ start:718 stop:1995 length:1278 start_codon:yes stop_codon:yes gene_type:complete